MLEVSNVCPACGQVHDGSKFGLKHRAPRECPRVVMGSFPLVSLPRPTEEAPVKVPRTKEGPARKSARSEPRENTSILLADSLTLVRPARETARNRALGVPWLPPPDLGEVV